MVEEPGGAFVETEVPTPEPKQGEALVKIAAAGVCLLDTKIRAGKAAHAKQPLPAVLGLDMAGTVIQVGPGVTKVTVGDEVFGMVGGVGGLQGTLAQLVCADVDLVALKPKNLTMREAAALPLNTITAWEGLIDRANVSKGKTVLVHAGAGGVGHLVAQIAKAYGAEVFATVSPEKLSIVEAYGVTPIDYQKLSVEEYLATYTHGEGFDIVYDTLGGATLDASFKLAKVYTGRVVSCLGWGTHALAPLSFRGATYSGVFTLLPLQTGRYRSHHGEILASAADLASSGKLRPLINETRFTSKDIAAAYALVESNVVGKVVVDIE
jgi:NADPH:quinone reductase-like Zn-dependent oxidoreductase